MASAGYAVRSAWVAAALAGWSPAAWADIEVNGTPHATLAAAVTAAVDGDTLVFDGATYSSTGVTILSKALTFEGNGSTIEGTAISDGSILLRTGTLTASDLTFTGTSARAIDANAGSALTLTDVTIATSTTQAGGGISLANPNLVELTRVVFDHTSATGDGGALYIVGASGPITLTDVTFDGTSSSGGDAGAIYADSADLTCDGCVFLGTTADDNGGAIYADDAALTVVDSRFEACTGGGTGGAVHTNALLDVESSTFCNTSSASVGGAIYSSAGGGSIYTTVFLDTAAASGEDGNAARLGGGTWTVHQNHVVSTSGGDNALYFNGATADVLGNVFLGNAGTAVTRSGGSFTTGGPRYDAFFGNGALVSGGGSPTNHVTVDPQLAGFLDDGLCGNDALWPGLGSPLIDASDPATFDPDGSRADIGAFGGADADPSLHVDSDGDTFGFLFDCDDDEPDAFPRDPEDDECDGVDNDCNGAVDDFVGNHPTWFEDCDNDGQGAASTAETQCDPPNSGCGWLPYDVGAPENGADCDDDRGDVYLGADEYCTVTDEDCDGIDGLEELGVVDGSTFYVDDDLDGFGDPLRPVEACQAFAGVSSSADDCDDTTAAVSPIGYDLCGDSVDQDCSGVDGPPSEQQEYWPDEDGDTFGDRQTLPLLGCEAPAGEWVDNDGDCDDDAIVGGAVHPGVPEVCDGVDQDCDDLVDNLDGVPVVTYYRDDDGDGFGDAGQAQDTACGQPPGFVLVAGDCDDDLVKVNPEATETCNGLDDDCDGAVDVEDDSVDNAIPAWKDFDGDGFGGCPDEACDSTLRCTLGEDGDFDWVDNDGDCDDSAADVNPESSEVPDNTVDENCDGTVTKPPGGTPPADEGCNCDQSGGGSFAPATLMLALLLARRRTR